MSLINKMLQDLDQRNAAPAAAYAGRSAALAQQLRPVKKPVLSEWFWYVMAVLMLFAVAWIIWLAWQLSPRPAVTELVYEPKAAAPAPAAAPKPAAAAPASPRSSVDVQTAASVGAPGPAAIVPSAPAKPAGAAPADAAKVDMLKLATAITTPVPEGKRAPRKASRSRTGSRTLGVKAAAPAVALSPAPGGIDRRASGTGHDRADAEFRRAINLINQGRLAEGLDGLRDALKIDPGYEAVRQTLVALLLEGKRIDEAVAVLRDGLALNPSNSAFATLLARAMVERNDVRGALALLQKHAPENDTNAEYHAFAAALYQRLERHGDAVAEYEAALKLSPNAGVWWLGLGISQQALNRPKDALDAFQRAKDTGSLAPELLSFADRRVKLLQ
jgi:MSHA biogenesis protein MshN